MAEGGPLRLARRLGRSQRHARHRRCRRTRGAWGAPPRGLCSDAARPRARAGGGGGCGRRRGEPPSGARGSRRRHRRRQGLGDAGAAAVPRCAIAPLAPLLHGAPRRRWDWRRTRCPSATRRFCKCCALHLLCGPSPNRRRGGAPTFARANRCGRGARASPRVALQRAPSTGQLQAPPPPASCLSKCVRARRRIRSAALSLCRCRSCSGALARLARAHAGGAGHRGLAVLCRLLAHGGARGAACARAASRSSRAGTVDCACSRRSLPRAPWRARAPVQVRARPWATSSPTTSRGCASSGRACTAPAVRRAYGSVAETGCVRRRS